MAGISTPLCHRVIGGVHATVNHCLSPHLHKMTALLLLLACSLPHLCIGSLSKNGLLLLARWLSWLGVGSYSHFSNLDWFLCTHIIIEGYYSMLQRVVSGDLNHLVYQLAFMQGLLNHFFNPWLDSEVSQKGMIYRHCDFRGWIFGMIFGTALSCFFTPGLFNPGFVYGDIGIDIDIGVWCILMQPMYTMNVDSSLDQIKVNLYLTSLPIKELLCLPRWSLLLSFH